MASYTGTTGADVLIDLGGPTSTISDTYTVNNIGDIIVEESTDPLSVDTVLFNGSSSFASYTLTDNIETLTLAAGATALNGTGNELNNTINGNNGVNTLDGAEGNDILNGNAGNDTLWGGNGADKLNGGADNDKLYGEGGADELKGDVGNDILDGGDGADKLTGGAGDDSYWVDIAGDVVTEVPNAGTDTVYSTITDTLDPNVENLVLLGTAAISGTGNALNNVITGNGAANTLSGADGNDTLNGGAGADNLNGGNGNDILDGGVGSDNLTGGAGNDIFYVNAAGDNVFEAASGGADEIRSTATSFTLNPGQEVEKLTLLGSAYKGVGNNLNNTIIGTASQNVLIGGDGNDTLDGGVGADKLQGGIGNDTYIVDNVGDTTDETTGGGGTDLVQSSVTYTLATDVDNLTLIKTAAINGTGNTGDNVLTGNSAKNTLTGGTGDDTLNGGTGDGQVDTLIGGDGSDTYIVDSTVDKIQDGGAAGTDLVKSSVTFSLAASVDLADIENLTLTGTVQPINGTGNGLANTITGNDGANTLNGGAADGVADTLVGGNGNDIYIVDNTNDNITEANIPDDISTPTVIEGGTDLVKSSATYSLAGRAGVENLTLTDGTASGGVAAIDGTGNGLANVITGNAGPNELDGGAADGVKDTLVGGLDSDIYIIDATNVVNTNPLGTGGYDVTKVDTITENSGSVSIGGVVISNGTADEVQSSATYSLGVASANLENLTLTGNANINGIGNNAANIIKGNSGDNVLDGGGTSDTKIDSLQGLAGDDAYIVYATNVSGTTGYDAAKVDVINDTAGTDEVRSSATYSLAVGNVTGVENLTLVGAGSINGTGSGGDNIINGGGGINTLNGGAGDDTLKGNGGNDKLIGGAGVDNLIGGTGADSFVYTDKSETGTQALSTADTIGDGTSNFETAEGDKIDLRQLDSDTTTPATIDPWTFIENGAVATDLVKGGVIFTTINGGNDGLLSFASAQGSDHVAEFEIVLTGVTTLSASDLLGVIG